MNFSSQTRCAALFFSLFALCSAVSGMSAGDSLSIKVYHKGEQPKSLPEVFPQHRPFTLVLHAHSVFRSEATALTCANLFADAPKLNGLQYYSHSQGKMTTLFQESVVLEHPRAQASSPAPVLRKLPLDTTFYIRQVDNRIGPVVYRATLRADSARVTFFLYNISPATKFGVQLVESGDFLLYIAAHRTQAGELELDAWQWQRFKDGLLGLFIKEASFVNRLKAVARYYQKALLKL